MPTADHPDCITYWEYYRAISFPCIGGVDRSLFIRIGNPSRWAKDYPWAAFRREEIVLRVAQATIAPGRVADIHDSYILVKSQAV